MAIVATFSNGETDTYKGHRDVKAAWAIINPTTGTILNSGHSLDRARAEKTAANNVKYTGIKPTGFAKGAATVPSRLYAHMIPYMARQCKERDLPGKNAMRELKAYNAAYYAAQRALVRIEVVDL